MALIMGEDRVSTAKLSVPAAAASLRLARLTASSLAADLDWSLDDIDDLRIAVDELTAALIQGLPGVTVELEYFHEGAAIVITGSCESEQEMEGLDPLALELLGLTTDRYRVESTDGHRRFTLEKRPAGGQPDDD
jgi:serine/threonine-protein kinase RsbW